MRKEEYIRKRGIAAYEELLQQSKDWKKAHPKERRVINNKWAERNPEKVKAHGRKISRKGGKYYEHRRQHQANGIPHEKVLIRNKHGYHYRSYKRIIAPDSVLHHEWLNDGTADFRGVALVEKDPHQYGYVDVIRILDGKITLLTEAEIRNGGM